MEKKQVLIRITDELHQKLKDIAEKQGISVNALVATILWEKINGAARNTLNK